MTESLVLFCARLASRAFQFLYQDRARASVGGDTPVGRPCGGTQAASTSASSTEGDKRTVDPAVAGEMTASPAADLLPRWYWSAGAVKALRDRGYEIEEPEKIALDALQEIAFGDPGVDPREIALEALHGSGFASLKTVYSGQFDLNWLRPGETVRSAGDGSGAAEIVHENGTVERLEIGAEVWIDRGRRV